ncbi:hypothetical protein [Streptomyces anulatus]|uniref:hypothetical protein n=1 Tax=Streptomyces anulatus TaxID=1892 RepID=UPI0037DCAD13|nr:hypothetical protein OHB50_39590 [Streptomyces anulatus]
MAAVTLTKTPRLHLYLAVVTAPGTPTARVHHLLLTRDEGYDAQVDGMHDKTNATPGAQLVCVVAGDRSAAYAEARKGEDANDDLFTQWIEQERTAAGL